MPSRTSSLENRKKNYMQKKTRIMALLGHILLCPTVNLAHSQPSLGIPVSDLPEKDSTNSKRKLDELIVMPFKQEKDLSLSPIASSTFNAGMIKNRNITDIKGISAAIPNFFMPDYGSKLTSPVYIRGIGSKINSPSVGLYVDDMPYFEKSAFDFNLSEIDRIEVLRGPQGTLYGRNTMGGLIKIYTRSPLKYQGTMLHAGMGSYLGINTNAAHYGKINNRLGYSVSANYNHSNGYFKNLYTGKNADAQNSASGRARLEWRLSEQLQMGVNTSLDYIDQGGYPYAPYDVSSGQTADVCYNDPGSYRRLMSTSGISLNYRAPRYSINSQTSFQHLNDRQQIDQDFSEKALYYARQWQTQNMVSEEFNIKSNGNSRYSWLFGAFGFWQHIDNRVWLDYLSMQKRSEKDYELPTQGVAFYHQSALHDLFWKGLSLTLGLRYDLEWASMDYSGVMRQLNTPEGGNQERTTTAFEPFLSKLHFGQLVPKVALQYSFPSSGIIYTSVSKGYKTGGFNTSFESPEQRSFKPEYSWNYEIGAKHPFFDNRMSAEVALFLIDWKNQQISQPLPSGKGSMLTNAGRSQSKGVEVSMTYNVYRGVTLTTNYGYTHATFLDYKKGNTDYRNKYLPFVPAHTFSVAANYTVAQPFHGVDRLNVNVDYNGNGRIYWKEDNIVSQPFYGLLNAKVSLSKGILTLSAWARNITTTDYVAFYFESGNMKLAQKGKPFTIGADVQLNF